VSSVWVIRGKARHCQATVTAGRAPIADAHIYIYVRVYRYIDNTYRSNNKSPFFLPCACDLIYTARIHRVHVHAVSTAGPEVMAFACRH
jgi:hypothetical protein